MISKNLLIHTVTLKKAAGIDRDRNETYEEYTIANTRVDITAGQAQGSEGESPSDAATLFIDAAHSKIANAEIELAQVKVSIGDKVEFDGRELEVRSIHPRHADGASAHHWEIGLA